MSLIAELQRRNVIRVAIAYVATAWLLIQIADTLFPIYGFGDATLRIVVAVLAVGFIPVVIFAWVFELTPQGLKRESEVDSDASITRSTGKKLDRAIIVVLSLALIYFAFDSLVLSESRIQEAREEGRTEALVESYGDKSIAVLPFADMSSAGDQEYMGDGVAEELLNLLAKIPELRVISRSSAFSFKGKDVDIPTIAEQLDVVHILEGSVRKAGNTIRITAQLIDARSDTHLWSDTYDRELVDIFAIQDEIAATVVEELKITLLGTPPTIREVDPAAYEVFLQARYFHEELALEDLQKARELYEAALAIDDQFVRALIWLGALYTDLANYGTFTAEEAASLERDAINRALAIDSDDALAIGLDGQNLVLTRGDVVAGASRLQQALTLDPANPMLLRWAAISLADLGMYEPAIEIGEYQLQRDPMGAITRSNLVTLYGLGMRFSDAVELARENMKLFPDNPIFAASLSQLLLHTGDPEGALAHSGAIENRIERTTTEAVAYYLLERKSDFDETIAPLLDQATSNPEAAFNAAYAYAIIGDADSMFVWLEQLHESGALSFIGYPPEALFGAYYKDPRWDPLMEKAGLVGGQYDHVDFNVSLPE